VKPGFRRQHNILLPGKGGSGRTCAAARQRADNRSERCTASGANSRAFAASLPDVFKLGSLNRERSSVSILLEV
jgi:predicted short-subunit dehydrogenase-like oxidoreductase (DUF2520 family)